MEYRWDLHHRRARNRDAPRCEAVDSAGHRCEYIAHGGRGHSALDGSVGWLTGSAPSSGLTVEAIHYDGGEDQAVVCEWIVEHGGAPAVGPFGGGLALDSVPRVAIPPGSWVVDLFGRLVVVSDDEVPVEAVAS